MKGREITCDIFLKWPLFKNRGEFIALRTFHLRPKNS